MNINTSLLALSIGFAALSVAPVTEAQVQAYNTATSNISLHALIEQALSTDAQRQQFSAQSQALRATGIASNTLMDPKIKFGVGGLPVDSFSFEQDPMTNISVGFMQEFGRGATLPLQQQKFNQQADGVLLQAANRELELTNGITQLWLELGFQQLAAQLLLEDKQLQAELVNFVATNYASGKGESQDLLQAQLQLGQLEEKLQANQQLQRRMMSQLSEWLGPQWLLANPMLRASHQLDWSALDQQLHRHQLDNNSFSSQHSTLLLQHPLLQLAQMNIARSRTDLSIADEAYLPQFAVEVMYAHRQADGMNGQPAADLVSAYLSVDIPLFTGNRQDQQQTAAQYQVEAAQSQQQLLLTQMNAKINALLVDKYSLEQRISSYQDTLVSQARARSKAVERGYQNNSAQFSDVITAARTELTLTLAQARLVTDLNITNSKIAYLLPAGTSHLVTELSVEK